MSQKEATKKYSFGYHRAEIVGALLSVFLIWGLTAWLVYEAINRLANPEVVDGEIMFIVACCGIAVNIVMSIILRQDHGHSDDEDMNVRVAFIHALGDLVQSVGVLIAAMLIWYDNERFAIADPICTLIFSVIVLFTTFKLMRDILDILMEAVPAGIDCNRIAFELRQLSDVEEVHDLHVWNLSMNKPTLSVHLRLSNLSTFADADKVLKKAEKLLRTTFGIKHSTIQIEMGHDDNTVDMDVDEDEDVKNE